MTENKTHDSKLNVLDRQVAVYVSVFVCVRVGRFSE